VRSDIMHDDASAIAYICRGGVLHITVFQYWECLPVQAPLKCPGPTDVWRCLEPRALLLG